MEEIDNINIRLFEYTQSPLCIGVANDSETYRQAIFMA